MADNSGQQGMSMNASGEIPTAGELLGRTHEELVLLLIQLRRRHTATLRAIDQCCAQISRLEVVCYCFAFALFYYDFALFTY